MRKRSLRLINLTCVPLTVDVLVTKECLIVSVMAKNTISVNLDELAEQNGKPLGLDGTNGQGLLIINAPELSADGTAPPTTEADEDDEESPENDELDDEDVHQRWVTHELDYAKWGSIDLMENELSEWKRIWTEEGFQEILELVELQVTDLPFPICLTCTQSIVGRRYLAIDTDRGEMQ